MIVYYHIFSILVCCQIESIDDFLRFDLRFFVKQHEWAKKNVKVQPFNVGGFTSNNWLLTWLIVLVIHPTVTLITWLIVLVIHPLVTLIWELKEQRLIVRYLNTKKKLNLSKRFNLESSKTQLTWIPIWINVGRVCIVIFPSW